MLDPKCETGDPQSSKKGKQSDCSPARQTVWTERMHTYKVTQQGTMKLRRGMNGSPPMQFDRQVNAQITVDMPQVSHVSVALGLRCLSPVFRSHC